MWHELIVEFECGSCSADVMAMSWTQIERRPLAHKGVEAQALVL